MTSAAASPAALGIPLQQGKTRFGVTKSPDPNQKYPQDQNLECGYAIRPAGESCEFGRGLAAECDRIRVSEKSACDMGSEIDKIATFAPIWGPDPPSTSR
jgi:hypothetical protein